MTLNLKYHVSDVAELPSYIVRYGHRYYNLQAPKSTRGAAEIRKSQEIKKRCVSVIIVPFLLNGVSKDNKKAVPRKWYALYYREK